MKSFKYILAMIAMLVLLGSTAIAQSTIAVKADGSGVGGYNTVEAAVDASVAGDTIEIQDNGVYNIKKILNLTDRNLKGKEGFLPTIKSTGIEDNVDRVLIFMAMDNSSIENIKFIGKFGTGAWPADYQIGAVIYGQWEIKNCHFIDFQAETLSFKAVDGKVLTGSMTGCYTVNSLGFRFEGSDGLSVATVSTMLFDHCTLLTLGNNFNLGVYFPTNGGTITVKNCVMGLFNKTLPWGFQNGKAFGINAAFTTEWTYDGDGKPLGGWHTSNDFNHSYNAYIGLWYFKWNWQDIDYVSSIYNYEIGPTEIGTTTQLVMDVGFTDPLNYDLTLKPNSKLIGKGEGGSTIGAYQTTTHPLPQIVVKQDGTGNFTTIEAAMAAATFADTIEIGDSGVYDLTADVHLLGMSLRGAEGVRPTIKHTEGGTVGRCIYEMQNGSLENLTLVGHATESQLGLAGGGHFVIKNCTFKNFANDSCIIMGAFGGLKLWGDISDTYFINCGENAIALAGWGSPTAADAGDYLISHCTFVNNVGPFVYIANGYPSSGGLVTIKNNIFTAYTGGAYVAAKPFGAEVLSKVRFKHSYNLFNKLDATGFGFVIDVNGSEIQDKDPMFLDMNNIELGVKATAPASPAIFKGENGSTMGVFQATPPNAAKSWTVFE